MRGTGYCGRQRYFQKKRQVQVNLWHLRNEGGHGIDINDTEHIQEGETEGNSTIEKKQKDVEGVTPTMFATRSKLVPPDSLLSAFLGELSVLVPVPFDA